MATRLSILNAALAELGEEPLYFATPDAAAAFSTAGIFDPEDDMQARAAAVYPQVRAELLNAYPWSWLTERARLLEAPYDPQARPPDRPAAEWPFPNRFHVPYPDIAIIRAVYSTLQSSVDERIAEPDGWTVQGPFLYAVFAAAYVEAQRDVAEEAWPQLFVNAITQACAARLSLSIKEDLPTTRYYDQMASLALDNAKRADAQSHPGQVIPRFEWVEARQSGFSDYHHHTVTSTADTTVRRPTPAEARAARSG